MTQTQEEQQAMREAYAALDEIEADERASRDSVLRVVKARVDSTLYAAIERCIEDCDDAGRAHSFSIVDQPRGDAQQSDYEFGAYHVHQYQNGGMSGDDFAGAIYIAIGQGQHLEFHYEQ